MKLFTLGVVLSFLTCLLTLTHLPYNLAAIIAITTLLTFYLTLKLIPKISQFMLNKNIYGLDINKKGSKGDDKHIPECIGFAAAVAFCMVGMVIGLVLKNWSQ